MKIQRHLIWLLVGLLASPSPVTIAASQNSYRTTIKKWRDQQEKNLKSDDGWLTVAGLFWLKEGKNNFGVDPSNEIVLPAGSAPARAGAFEFHEGNTTLRVADGVNVTVKGQAITNLEMRSDASGEPDIIALGGLTMQVIKRGARYGIRVKDKNSKQRREFTGLRWFPVRESYRVAATFVPHNPPKEVAIPNVLGYIEQMPSPGYAVFKLAGKQYRLDPVMSGKDKLFFIFRDLTSGSSTYPGGRFLYTDLPEGGQVTLDFNQAVNPPCAFTAFATCPLPPPQNRLKVAIEAGELSYHAGNEKESSGHKQ
jgi:uncharacterized protein